jgi:hypothetical protein
MPYSIHVAHPGFEVVNTVTGKVHAKHATHENATKQVRLLYALEKDMLSGKRTGSYSGREHDYDSMSHKNAVAGKY